MGDTINFRGKKIKDLTETTTLNPTDDIVVEDDTPETKRVKWETFCDAMKDKIEDGLIVKETVHAILMANWFIIPDKEHYSLAAVYTRRDDASNYVQGVQRRSTGGYTVLVNNGRNGVEMDFYAIWIKNGGNGSGESPEENPNRPVVSNGSLFVETRTVSLSYASSTLLRGHEVFNNKIVSAVACIEDRPNTPVLQTNNVYTDVGYAGYETRLEVYAKGSNYVPGHVLAVHVIVVLERAEENPPSTGGDCTCTEKNFLGTYEEFTSVELTPGEWAVITEGDPSTVDGRSLYMCFAPEVVMRIPDIDDVLELQKNGATAEEIQSKVQSVINELNENGTLSGMTIGEKSITKDKLADNAFDDIKIAVDGYVDYYETAEIVQSMYNPANGTEYKGGISSVYTNLEVGKRYAYPCNSFSGYLGCLFFDTNENYLSGMVATQDATVHGYMIFKVPENTAKVIISMEWMGTSVVDRFKLFEVNDNIELGEEYISGINGKPIVDMSVFAKMKKVNLISEDNVAIGKMVSGAGAESNSAGRNLYTVECEELTNYTINYDPEDKLCMFFFYDDTGNVISGLSHSFGGEDLGSEINFGNIGVGRILTTVTQKTINGVMHHLQTFTTPFGAKTMKLTTAGSLRGKIVLAKGTAEDWVPSDYKFEDVHMIAKPYADKVIYTLGDSITAGTNGGYQRYIRDITGASVVNYAYSGLTASSLSDKICTDDIDFTKADAVTIMIGTNGGVGTSSILDVPYIIGSSVSDIEEGGTVIYNGGEISTIEDYWALFDRLKFHSAIAKMIEWVKWKNPDCEIYLLTPLPNAFRGLTLDGGHEAIRNAMLELNKLYSTPVIDLVRESGVCLHNIAEYTYDNTHYNEKGNKAVGTYVAYQLNIR